MNERAREQQMEILAPRLLQQILDELELMYGVPEPPEVTDPFEIVLWENIVYLSDDDKRRKAFRELRGRVGTRPEDILGAPATVLLEIASVGMLPEQRVEKMRFAAELAADAYNGDLLAVARLPMAAAKKAIKRFPGIGDPGAEKILLFSRSHLCFPLDSNGLRVLLRLGYGKESSNYAASYRSAQSAVADELKLNYDWLIRAHQLLRRHGQETCKTTAPRCGSCAVTAACEYFRRR